MLNGGLKNRLIFLGVFFIGIFFFVSEAKTATLYFSPSSPTYTIGDTFQISLFVSSADQAMNAAQATVNFPADRLEIISVSTKNSIFSLMVENPVFSNVNGAASFSGIVLNPGYTGKSGRLVTLNFRAKALGLANLSISNAQVLANDGLGTNILTSRGSGTVSIIEKKIEPIPPKPVPLPPPTIFIPTTTIPTTTVEEPIIELAPIINIITSTVCSIDQLPYVFLKIGPVTFDSASLSLLFLIIMILIAAVVSFWGFFEAHLHQHMENKKIKKSATKKSKK
jgi:hypothetical protein